MKFHLLDGPATLTGTLIDLVQLAVMGLVAFWLAAILVCGAFLAIRAGYLAIKEVARTIWGALK